MKSLLLVVLVMMPCALCAQAPYIQPDFYNDPLPEHAGVTVNAGQTADEFGDPASQVIYYTEGGKIRMFMLKNSTMAFTLATMDTLPATPDTIRSLHMRFIGEASSLVDPIAYGVRNLKQNFHMAHCNATGVESYYRVIYENVYPFIDVHVYHGLYGEKLAIVMRPGADPQMCCLNSRGRTV
ncbi:MAG: hypothetical protein IPJ76_10580 [Flavobacteriales bacterium]|nr:MAG: hypothetical protein IPJ76_10580 [Flavobacteriales bacterium]